MNRKTTIVVLMMLVPLMAVTMAGGPHPAWLDIGLGMVLVSVGILELRRRLAMAAIGLRRTMLIGATAGVVVAVALPLLFLLAFARH